MQDTSITAIAAVAGAVVGAAGAIISNAITNHAANKREKREAERSDAWMKEDIRRQRLEELYMVFSSWAKMVMSIFMNSFSYMLNVVDGVTFDKLANEQVKEMPKDELEKAAFLVKAYFPSVVPLFDEVIEQRDKVNVMRPITSNRKKPSHSTKEHLDAYEKQMEVFSEKTDNFKDALIQIARGMRANQL